MKSTRIACLVATSCVLLSAVSLAVPAHATGYQAQFMNPSLDTRSQTLFIRMTGVESETWYVTIRSVDPKVDPDMDTVCPDTMATNTDKVLIGPYLVTASGVLEKRFPMPLGRYGICLYNARPGQTTRAQAVLGYTKVAGYVVVTPPPRPTPTTRATRLSFGVMQSRAGVTVWGRVTVGPPTGKVAIQAKSGRNYVTIATLPVKAGVYRAAVPARTGQTIRAVLLASPGWAASRSADVPLR